MDTSRVGPGIAIEMAGAPAWVVKAFRRRAAFEQRRESAPPRIHVPERSENAERPRERRARRAGSSRDGPSSSESDPPPAGPRLTRAERAALKDKVDARRRELVAASEKVERSLERHWSLIEEQLR
jgi:hypothetical protein